MDKDKLMEIKKSLLLLGLAGTMIGAAFCLDDMDENGIPKYTSIPHSYSHIDDYYKFVMQNGEAVKLYNSSNVYLLFNKETYDVSEYIYYGTHFLGGLSYIELYDLPNEKMLHYCDGIVTTYNSDYYNYLMNNNYQVCLKDVSDYVEGYVGKEYYSLDEIRELESPIAEGLKIINSLKVKTK